MLLDELLLAELLAVDLLDAALVEVDSVEAVDEGATGEKVLWPIPKPIFDA